MAFRGFRVSPALNRASASFGATHQVVSGAFETFRVSRRRTRSFRVIRRPSPGRFRGFRDLPRLAVPELIGCIFDSPQVLVVEERIGVEELSLPESSLVDLRQLRLLTYLIPLNLDYFDLVIHDLSSLILG